MSEHRNHRDDERETDQQPQKAGHEERAHGDEDERDDVAARHPTGDREEERDEDAAVEEASRDSYPGSDAPAW